MDVVTWQWKSVRALCYFNENERSYIRLPPGSKLSQNCEKVQHKLSSKTRFQNIDPSLILKILSTREAHRTQERTAFRKSPPSPTAPPTVLLAYISPVAWLREAHFPGLGLRRGAIDLSGLVENPGPFCTKILWEMLEPLPFFATRRQAKNPRSGVLYIHVSIPRHFANDQYRLSALE